jgi:hypothetical protein
MASNRTMQPFRLYWVETPSAEENCFVAARSKRAAERFEENGTGFDLNDCEATPIRQLDDEWVSRYRATDAAEELATPFYVQTEDVHELGIAWRIVEGDDVFVYGNQTFLKQGTLNYFASLVKRQEVVVIRSVSDLLEAIRKPPSQNEWIFRGHSSAFWSLKASVHRLSAETTSTAEKLVEGERWLLDEFKRRARTFLPLPPSSDWEWLVLAQHFGLPTRLLDWTENPLVALFFAVRDRNEVANDGMLYAYHHGAKAIDLSSTTDPFTLDQIELVRPPHLDQRVIVQQSVFTAEPPLYDRGGREESDIRYWYVSVRHKANIRNDLAQLGISESSMFPGLASLALQIGEEFMLSNAKAARSGKKCTSSARINPERIINTEPTRQS